MSLCSSLQVRTTEWPHQATAALFMALLLTSHRQLASQGCRWIPSINSTLPEQGRISLWRRTHPTTLWSPPLVICRRHPNRRGLTPHRCFYIRAVTAERTHGCGMFRRSLPSCTPSAARIMPMLSSKRYVRSVVFLSVICPRSFVRYKALVRCKSLSSRWVSTKYIELSTDLSCAYFFFYFELSLYLALTVLCTSAKR